MNTQILKKENFEQIKEALSDVNRYYYWLKTGIENPTTKTLIMFYVESGGAEAYRKKQK